MSKIQLNAVAVTLLLLAVLIGNRSREITLTPVPQSHFENIPLKFGEWIGRDSQFDESTRQQLPSASLLYRFYERKTDIVPSGMAIVYATDLGDFHQPEVCLEGQGLKTVSKGIARIKDGKGGTFDAVTLVTEADYQRRVFLFWFYSNGEASTSLGSYKIRILKDRLMGKVVRRSAMIRLDTPVLDGEEEAIGRLVQLANDSVPYLRAQFDEEAVVTK